MSDQESPSPKRSRRSFLRESAAGVTAALVWPNRDVPSLPPHVPFNAKPISVDDIQAAERVIGLSFTPEDRQLMLEDLTERLAEFGALRDHEPDNDRIPALLFDPRIGGEAVPEGDETPRWPGSTPIGLPAPDHDLAFAGVHRLSRLLREREISSRELTEMCMERLKRFDPVLEAVVTLTEERALESADRADAEIARGEYRGPLHGIPYGAKDLLAMRGYPTTWGAEPYRNQVLDYDAAVVERLDRAGAVPVAKLTLGALAWGDVWFGGKTRNPWNIEEGSSGSSAGPGSAVSAGLVPFAIGSETYGSIVSPSTRNGVTGHRPTFGRVSRHGAMALSWSMDKLGPMCRSALDCAIVFDAIRGADGRDPSTVSAPFGFNAQRDVRSLRVGYVETAFDGDYQNRDADLETLRVLREDLGIELQPVSLPIDLPIDAMIMILDAEAAAAFDGLTRSRGTDLMVRQERRAWPNAFRAARFMPAVEYIQANRIRTELLMRMNALMSEVDIVVSPAFEGQTLPLTNLTGHPAVCVPNHFHPVEGHPDRRSPGSITFIGRLYGDDRVLELAHAYQQVTDFHLRRPPIT